MPPTFSPLSYQCLSHSRSESAPQQQMPPWNRRGLTEDFTPVTWTPKPTSLFSSRMSRDLHVMYEPPDLSTPEAAAHTVVMIDRLLANLDSHHRAIKALNNQLQRYRLKPRHGLQVLDSSRT